MIKFEYNGQPYSIRFRYADRSKGKFQRVSADTFGFSIETRCDIVSQNRVVTGIALCMDEDNFSKETGRQISLERAIKGFKLDPSSVGEERFLNAILDAYWNRSELSAMQRKSFDELREIRRKADVRKKIRLLERELKGLKKSIGEK